MVHELGRILAADKVVNNVGVTDSLLDRLGVAQIVFLPDRRVRDSITMLETKVSYDESNPTEITSDLQVSLRHLLTVGDDNGASLRSWMASIPALPSDQLTNIPSLLTM